jgi:AGCS family alanine or glycine:cation symporter
MLQSHTVGRALLASYGISPYLVTGAMAVTTAVVVLGGVRRVGRFSGWMVPLMSFIYLTGGLLVIVLNYQRIPEVFQTIFTYAFKPMAGVGGVTGIAVATVIKQGMARGMLSNEAGLGTAPMVHAVADTPHPFEQGLWGAFEVFMDTVVVCTITAFAILSTGALATGESGIELLLAAFTRAFPEGTAEAVISLSIATFCLSTQIGFFIYFETCLVSLVGTRAFKWLRWIYFLPGVIFAGVADVDQLWIFANISVAVVAIPNLLAMVFLSGVFIRLMRDHISGENRYATAKIDDTDDVMRRWM